MTRRCLLAMLPALAQAGTVELRRRSADGTPLPQMHNLDPRSSAIVICDMWDRHWCRGANERVPPIARRAAPLLEKARSRGMLIIHAPSDTMSFYADAPQRRAALAIPKADPPPPRPIDSPKLPIDDTDGGCDTPGDKQFKAWSRQHPSIVIGPNDLVSDDGAEVYSALKLRGIETLFGMGVHTNMCILNRTFAIKQMTRWGVQCVLIRDLTDAMYDPADSPRVSHERGTELVVEYIERHWCPSVMSTQLLKALDS